MSEIKILKKNPNELVALLSCVLSEKEQDKIMAVARDHCKLLMELSKGHLIFAKSIKNKKNWRQKISRLYYACYNASKAIRLNSSGHYSQEGRDHQKIGDLPKEFDKKEFWADFLGTFRADRNTADYGHSEKYEDLAHSLEEYINYSEEFYNTVKSYLRNRGIYD